MHSLFLYYLQVIGLPIAWLNGIRSILRGKLRILQKLLSQPKQRNWWSCQAAETPEYLSMEVYSIQAFYLVKIKIIAHFLLTFKSLASLMYLDFYICIKWFRKLLEIKKSIASYAHFGSIYTKIINSIWYHMLVKARTRDPYICHYTNISNLISFSLSLEDLRLQAMTEKRGNATQTVTSY